MNITNIPAPRVPFIDERTGLMAREWYRFFLNLFVLTGSGNNPITLEELQLGPPNPPDLTELLIQINQNIAPQYEDQSGDFLKTLDTAQLMSMMSQFANAEAAIQGAYLQPVVQTGTIANYNLDGSPTAGGVAYGTGPALAVNAAGTLGQVLTSAGAGVPTWTTPTTGTVTSVSVVSANGLAGTVANATTTPAITLSTSITGVLLGNGTAISAAVSGTNIKTVNGTTLLGAGDLGTITYAYGGTGLTSYTAGDIIYASAANTVAKLAIGTSGQRLVVAAGLPSWATDTTTGTVTSVAASVPAFLSVAGSPITSSGTLAITLSGTALPVLNGGTGVTTSTGTGNTVLSAAPTLSGNVNLSTGNLVIGTSGKGIDFSVTSSGSGTMTSELLADYEEGTFDPRLSFATGGDTFTYDGRVGAYTKVGRLVTLNLLISTTAKGAGTGNLSLINFPFTAAGYASVVPRTSGITNTGPISAYTFSGQSSLSFFTVSTLGVETQITNTSVGAAVVIVASLTYITS